MSTPGAPQGKIVLEDLPVDRQKEVKDMKAAIDTVNLTEAMNITGDVELNIYYDKKRKQISYVPVSEQVTDKDNVRIGTIGAIDITKMQGIIVHKAEGLPDVYECDDGENNFDRTALKTAGYKIKRSFIDASVVNHEGLVIYLSKLYEDEDAFAAQVDILIQNIGKELGITPKIPI